MDSKTTEGAELVRVALNKHQTPVSRIVSIAVKMLRRQCPGLRLLISFADPAQGHHGGIYQAMGWTYCWEVRNIKRLSRQDGPHVARTDGQRARMELCLRTEVASGQGERLRANQNARQT